MLLIWNGPFKILNLRLEFENERLFIFPRKKYIFKKRKGEKRPKRK